MEEISGESEVSVSKAAKIPRKKIVKTTTTKQISSTKSLTSNGNNGSQILLPKEILKASIPGPTGEEDFNYDVCVIRAAFKRDRRGLIDSLDDETTPLLPNKRNQGFSDDNHTFPKHIYLTDTPRDSSANFEGTFVSRLPNSGDLLTFPSDLSRDSTHSEVNVATKDKGGHKNVTRILCAITVFVIIATIACVVFYILSTCPAIPSDNNMKQQCTSQYRFLSECALSCNTGLILKGAERVQCGFNRRWSASIPTCECPACYEGPQCQYSIDWKKISAEVSTVVRNVYKTIHYGNHTVECNGYWTRWLKYKCECVDNESGYRHTCGPFKSIAGACTHTLANLIEDWVKAGEFPVPCNAAAFNRSLQCKM